MMESRPGRATQAGSPQDSRGTLLGRGGRSHPRFWQHALDADSVRDTKGPLLPREAAMHSPGVASRSPSPGRRDSLCEPRLSNGGWGRGLGTVGRHEAVALPRGSARKAEGLGPSLFYTQVCFAAGKGGRSLSRSVTPQVNPTPCWIALSCPRGGRSDASRSG